MPLQVFSSSLQQVVDIVVSHQALREKCQLVSLLLDAIVRPAPELFRPQLRRMTFLLGECSRQEADWHAWLRQRESDTLI